MKRWKKEWGRRIFPLLLRWSLRFLGGAVLSCAGIFDGRAPFALGFVAAAGARFDGLFAACGAIVGSILFLDFPRRIRFVAAVVLIFSASMAFYDVPFYKKRHVRALIAAALLAAASPAEVLVK